MQTIDIPGCTHAHAILQPWLSVIICLSDLNYNHWSPISLSLLKSHLCTNWHFVLETKGTHV